MKISVQIPDELASRVQRYAGGKTIEESLRAALEDWVALQRTRELNAEVRHRPLEFAPGVTGAAVRERNRRRG